MLLRLFSDFGHIMHVPMTHAAHYGQSSESTLWYILINSILKYQKLHIEHILIFSDQSHETIVDISLLFLNLLLPTWKGGVGCVFLKSIHDMNFIKQEKTLKFRLSTTDTTQMQNHSSSNPLIEPNKTSEWHLLD